MTLVRHILRRVGFYLLVVLLGSFFTLPVLWLFTAPFHSHATLRIEFTTKPTLDNFRAVLRNNFAMQALLKNSLIQAGGAMLLTTALASLAAYVLARVRIPARDLLIYVLILFSSVVTGTAAMVPIFLLIHHIGLIDTHLAVIFVFTGGLLPTAIFIMRDFLSSLPSSYEESAMVSGANSWQILRHIVLPQIRPGIMVVAVWAFVNVWSGFFIPFILLRSPDKMPAATATYSFYTEAGTPMLTLVSAYALLYIIPVVALYIFVNRRYGFRFFGGIKS